jgi:hypothetical protein
MPAKGLLLGVPVASGATTGVVSLTEFAGTGPLNPPPAFMGFNLTILQCNCNGKYNSEEMGYD